MPDWARHAIWWQVYPLGFTGAPSAAATADEASAADAPGRLARLLPWLDYLVRLGCNGLALGPVFASGTHGYDTTDHYRIDSRLGGEADLRRLLEACRERGVRVLLDGVFNHVGRDFGPFRDVLAHGRESAYVDWFRLDWAAGGPDGFGYADFEGHRQLVALNHAEPAVADYVTGVMNHWLDAGADGWRLDAAYAVPREFWHTVTGRVRARHPRAWLVGEVIHGDYPAWVREGGLDSVTQYELWKAIWSSCNDGNLFELAWALKRHNELLPDLLPMTFVGNHDVTRPASKLDDQRHLGHALALLFFLPGIPSVYSGDEQAFRGVKEDRAGGDDAVRPEFPSTPDELAPYGWGVYRCHQQLIGIRRRHPWLATTPVTVAHLANCQLALRSAAPGGGDALMLLLNIADTAHTFDTGEPVHEVLATGGTADGADPARVGPHNWSLVRL